MKPTARRTPVPGLLLAALVLAAGCTMVGKVRKLVTLSQGIASTFAEPGVSADLAGEALTIRIANSRRQTLSDSERTDFARQVALYVQHHLPDSLPVRTVSVVLGTVSGGGGFTTSRWETVYVLHLPDPGDTTAVAEVPGVTYFPFAFACPRGDTVRVRFAADSAYVLLPRDRTVHQLPRAISASGARYSDGGLTFWNKGDSAFVMRGDSIVIRDCGEVPEGE